MTSYAATVSALYYGTYITRYYPTIEEAQAAGEHLAERVYRMPRGIYDLKITIGYAAQKSIEINTPRQVSCGCCTDGCIC
jgi:hypothetical protein